MILRNCGSALWSLALPDQIFCIMYFLFYHLKEKNQNNKQYNEKNKNKDSYFKKLHHSEALSSMASMGHHTGALDYRSQ